METHINKPSEIFHFFSFFNPCLLDLFHFNLHVLSLQDVLLCEILFLYYVFESVGSDNHGPRPSKFSACIELPHVLVEALQLLTRSVFALDPWVGKDAISIQPLCWINNKKLSDQILSKV